MQPLPDTQGERDTRGINIARAGVSRLRYPVQITRPDGTSFTAAATASLTVSVPAAQRGTHMSRFVECLHKAAGDIQPAAISRLARTLRTRLKAATAHVELSLPWFIEKKAPITGGAAWMDYEVTWQAVAGPRTNSFTTTVKVPVGTLCPCSKAISDRGAHNQRGYVTLTVETTRPSWPDELIAMVESSASTELFSLLKRPDEKFVTEKAYDEPVFVEDLVRAVAVRVKALKGLVKARIEAENFESIHSHNALAVVELSR